MTKYQESGDLCIESWLQINAFGRCFCFSRKIINMGPRPRVEMRI